jgi:DNA-binding response OmpR family regulator
MKLLLVEDDPEIQLVARLALKRAGFLVSTADSGAEALASVNSDPPSVILLDWMMPDMEGPEVCERLKDDPATRTIPVIFMTARSQQAEIERGLALGAAGFIHKPFDALALGERVRQILNQR